MLYVTNSCLLCLNILVALFFYKKLMKVLMKMIFFPGWQHPLPPPPAPDGKMLEKNIKTNLKEAPDLRYCEIKCSNRSQLLMTANPQW